MSRRAREADPRGARARGGPAAAGRAGARAALGRARTPSACSTSRCGSPGDGARAPRRLRAARLRGRGRRALRGAVRAAGRGAAVHRPRRPEGNLQAWARDAALRRGARLAASATPTSPPATPPPTRSRPCSTGSPPRRAAARCSACARATAGSCARCSASGAPTPRRGAPSTASPWREDPTQRRRDAFARNRARHGLVPALRELHPAAEANVLRTRRAAARRGRGARRRRHRRARRGRRPAVASSACARCRPRSPAWSSSGSPTRPAARPSRHRTDEILAPRRATARSTSAAACAPGSRAAA